MSKVADRAIVAQLQRWHDAGFPDYVEGGPTVVMLAEAVGQTRALVRERVEALRMQGKVEWDRLALRPSMLATPPIAAEPVVAEPVAVEPSPSPAEPAADSGDWRAAQAARLAVRNAEIIAAWQAGESVAALAERFGVTGNHVTAIQRAAGIAQRGEDSHLAERNAAIVAAYCDEGLTQEAVGARFGLSSVTVGYIMKQAGVTARTRGGARPESVIPPLRAAVVAEEMAARLDAQDVARATRLADAVKADAEAAGQRRAAARSTGTVVAKKGILDASALPTSVADALDGLSAGGRIQGLAMQPGAAAAAQLLREAWPGTFERLVRLAARCGERPLMTLVRVIDEAANAAGVHRAKSHSHPDDADDEGEEA